MRQLKTLSIIIFCALSLSFLTLVPESQANPIQQEVSQSQPYYFMGFFDRFQAKSKKTEGQLQEAKGKLTDDQGEQLKGKAKQAQGTMMESGEDVGDSIKKTTKNVQKSFKKTSDNLSESLQELGDKLEQAIDTK